MWPMVEAFRMFLRYSHYISVYIYIHNTHIYYILYIPAYPSISQHIPAYPSLSDPKSMPIRSRLRGFASKNQDTWLWPSTTVFVAVAPSDPWSRKCGRCFRTGAVVDHGQVLGPWEIWESKLGKKWIIRRVTQFSECRSDVYIKVMFI